jgi:hypothetical protein
LNAEAIGASQLTISMHHGEKIYRHTYGTCEIQRENDIRYVPYINYIRIYETYGSVHPYTIHVGVSYRIPYLKWISASASAFAAQVHSLCIMCLCCCAAAVYLSSFVLAEGIVILFPVFGLDSVGWHRSIRIYIPVHRVNAIDFS